MGSKIPSFDDLVAFHGSPFKVIRYLHAVLGYDAFKIAEYSKLPHYLVELYLEGEGIKSSFLFTHVAEFYKRLGAQSTRKAKITILKEFYRELSAAKIPLEPILRFMTGYLVDKSLGISKSITSPLRRVLTESYNQFEVNIKKYFQEYGDYSELAYFFTPEDRKPILTTEEIYRSINLLERFYRIKTPNSFNHRIAICSSILRKCTPDEARFFIRLLLRDLKLMYSISTVSEVISQLYRLDFNSLIAAQAMIGPIPAMRLGIKEGNKGLSKITIKPGVFIRPMLAQLYSKKQVQYPVLAEIKWDGSRIQIHKQGKQIRIFTRRGIEKSLVLPELINIANEFKAINCIIDAEVVAIDIEGKIKPWDILLKRTVQKFFKPELITQEPVTIKAFDILFLENKSLIHLPLMERKANLEKIVPENYLSKWLYCETEEEVQEIYQWAIDGNFEGIIVKTAKSQYYPNFRSEYWLKLKKWGDTIDTVIVKAKFGKGKLGGVFGSFFIAVRDPNPAEKKLYIIGRVGNLSQEHLEELKHLLQKYEIRRDDQGVVVKPEIVIEVTYIEIIKATDPDYTSGYALRNPKVKEIRYDKSVNEIDDLNKVKLLYKRGRIQNPFEEG